MSTAYSLLNVTLNLSSDDASFCEEFLSIFGGRQQEDHVGLAPAALSAQLTAPSSDGWGEIDISSTPGFDGAAFLLGFSSPTVPLKSVPDSDAQWAALALGDDPEPVFAFSGTRCRFRAVPRWRRILAHYLFLRMLALRDETMFFHAAAVGIGGRGILLVGPKGAGKSTLSVGLASRGHEFLGDETAAYVPGTGHLLPFRRPAGIKPGPRAAAVTESLLALTDLDPDEEGILRVEVSRLFPLARARSLPLHAVVFLSGFGTEARVEVVQPGRDELSSMQPMATTLAKVQTARVFALIRLLNSVRCFKMAPAHPDKSIDLLEEVLSV